MLWIILIVLFCSVSFLVYTLTPKLFTQTEDLAKKQTKRFFSRVDRVLQKEQVQTAYKLYVLGPIAGLIGGFFMGPEEYRLLAGIGGLVGGIILPRILVAQMIRKRKSRFNDQLMDALMIMSSSFRGGMSLIQAIEAVTEEMPDPIKYEFSLVIGENKMGVSLDETLGRLYKRLPSSGLQQMVTSILLARETGGNLPAIFSRIINSMREKKKIEQNMATLTVQGKIQAAVMTGLPILFVIAVQGSNPKYFDPMLHSDIGQKIVVFSVIWWLIGAFFIIKICTIKEY